MRVLAAVRVRTTVTQAAASLASHLGLSPYDVALRLGGELPRVLAMLPAWRRDPVADAPFRAAWESDPGEGLLRRCASAGVDAVLFEEREVIDDRRRIHARSLSLRDDALGVHAAGATEFSVPWSSVRLVLRVMHRRFEPRRAVRVETSAARAMFEMRVLPSRPARAEAPPEHEPALILYASGVPPVVLRDGVDFGFLGEAMRATRVENLQTLRELLRARAFGAVFDDRLLRVGAREKAVGAPLGRRGSAQAQLDLAAHALDLASRAGMLSGG